MQKAYREKDADYYTLYEDIAAELPQYREQLRGKRIICPCDWDESYNEELVYKEEGVTASDLFSNGSIKHLDLAASKNKFEKDFDAIKCQFVKFLVAHAEAYGIRSISVSGYNPGRISWSLDPQRHSPIKILRAICTTTACGWAMPSK